jgi:hypothetical protein
MKHLVVHTMEEWGLMLYVCSSTGVVIGAFLPACSGFHYIWAFSHNPFQARKDCLFFLSFVVQKIKGDFSTRCNGLDRV